MKKILLALLCITIAYINIKAQQKPFLQWQKTLGGSDYDGANSIQQTKDGGYIIAGFVWSNDGDVTGNHGIGDYWIVKLDATGKLQWQKAYGGTGDDDANSIQQTKDGGYIVAGNTWSNDGDVTGNHGTIDCWTLKLNSLGNIQWQKTYGGSRPDRASSIQQTNDGGYIIAGGSYSDDGDVTEHHGSIYYEDCWIVKLDAQGNIEWQKSLGGSNNNENASSIQQTTDGGYIIAGHTQSSDGGWVVKLNALGKIQWQKELGEHDATNSIQQTTDKGYIIAGGNYGDYWIIKLSAAGEIQWKKRFGGSGDDEASSIWQTNDKGYIVAGTSWSNDGDITDNHGIADYWTIKLDSSGNILWQKALGGTTLDQASSIQQTVDGGYIIAGGSESNDGNVTGNHSDHEWDFWIVKLSPEILGTNISLYPYKIVANCYPANAISCTMKNNAKAVVVKLYRYGVLLDSALNVTDHTGFTNLPCGDYYATATDENGNISFSKEVQIVPTPINTTTTNITSTKAQLNWTGFECPDDYLIEFHIQGNTEWIKKAPGNVHNFVLDRLLPATTYVWRVASEKRVNGIKATGRFSDSLTFITVAVAKMPNNALSITLNPNQLIVSPNPAKNYFVINFKDQIQEKVNAILYNVNGKAVWNSGLVNASSLNNKTTNTTSLARGVYYLKLIDENGRIISAAKVIIAN